MSSVFQPKGLENWVSILDDHLLPVLPASARQASRLLKSPDASLYELGNVIARDPVMRVHVVRECNRQFGERAAGVLANPHHCASMLGLDKLNVLMRQFKATRGDARDPRDYHYFQAISTSLHAAEQAAAWAQYRNQAGADSMFLGALLYGVPNWCLWRFAHREMNIIQVLFRREQIPLQEAERAVLGCTREAIAVELARRWHIPENIREALSSAHLPSPRFLLRCARRHQQDPHYRIPNRTESGQLVNSNALPLALSHQLAQEAARDWYSPHTRRLLDIIAAYLERPISELENLVKHTAVESARRWVLPGTLAPAANLIWPSLPRRPRHLKPGQLPAAVASLYAAGQNSTENNDAENNDAQNKRQTASHNTQPKPQAKPIGIRSEHLPEDLDRQAILGAPRPAAAPVPGAVSSHSGFLSLEKKQAFETLMHRLLQEPEYFSTEFESIHSVVDVLADCTPLQRVLVLLYQRTPQSVQAYYARGCDQHPTLAKYRISLQHNNLFSQLLKQPAATWISPERPSKVAGLVPGTFKQAAQSDHFIMMSVFNHRGAFGLFYADRGPGERMGLSEAEYKIFRLACSTCSKHLVARGKRAAAKPANQ